MPRETYPRGMVSRLLRAGLRPAPDPFLMHGRPVRGDKRLAAAGEAIKERTTGGQGRSSAALAFGSSRMRLADAVRKLLLVLGVSRQRDAVGRASTQTRPNLFTLER